MIEVLFIGGREDGLRYKIHDTTTIVETGGTDGGRYFIHEHMLDSGSFYVATQDSEPDAAKIMQALVDGYRWPVVDTGSGGIRQRCWEVYTDKNQPYEIKQLMHAVICHIDDTGERAEAAEAKLAELDKQKPVAYRWEGKETGKICYDGIKPLGITSQPLFTRPAPAVSLAELVPDKKSTDIDYAYYPLTKARHEGYNECVDDILRNIEEQAK